MLYPNTTGKVHRVTVTDVDGVAIDMSAATGVAVHLRDALLNISTRTPSIVDGKVEYLLDDLIPVAGKYHVQIAFTFDGVTGRSATYEFRVASNFT